MTNNDTTRIELTPDHTDLEIASLVHRALAAVRGTGRFGDRKVFISALWEMVLRLDTQAGGRLTDGCTIEDFKAWLLRSRRLTRDGTEKGAPLVVLVRADFVAAMDHSVVMASETNTDGSQFHFVYLEPAVIRRECVEPSRSRRCRRSRGAGVLQITAPLAR